MIIFLYGENNYLRQAKLNELIQKFKREIDHSGNNIRIVDAEKADLGEIHEAIFESSLFVLKRMVVIKNALANKALRVSLPELLQSKKISEDDKSGNIVVFCDEHSGEKLGANKLFKFLSAQKFVQQFKPLSNTETGQWIKKTVEERGGKITLRTAGIFAGLAGNDLWRLSGEIDKLIAYKKTSAKEEAAEIEEADVKEMVRGNFDENIFALTDAISRKDKAQTLKLLEEELANGLAEPYLIHMLIRQFRILLMVKEALESGQTQRKIAGDFKLHPFVVQKAMAQTRNFSLDFLKNIFSQLVSLDRNLKTGKGELRVELAVLIAGLA